MIKLRDLRVSGFRGARFELHIDFTKDQKSVSVFGDNAAGKSTITDALEWFLLGKVDHLWREDCYEEALRNSLLDETQTSEVSVEFSSKEISAKKALGADLKPKADNKSLEFRSFIESIKSERVFLRHADITEFVGQTKNKKREAIAEIIGYEDILAFRDTIQGASNALRKDVAYTTAKQLAENAKDSLFQLESEIISSEAQLFKKATGLTAQFNLDAAISSDASYDDALERLRAKIAKPESAETRLRLASLKKDCEDFSASVNATLGKRDKFLEVYSKLIDDKNIVSQLNIESFLTQGREIIASGHFTDPNCPFCLAPRDLHELRGEVERRIQKITQIRDRYEDTKALKGEFITALNSAKSACDRLASGHDGIVDFKGFAAAASPVALVLSAVIDGANQKFSKFESIVISEQELGAIENLSSLAGENAKLVQDAISALQFTEKDKDLLQTIDRLRDLRKNYRQYEEHSGTVKVFESQILSLSAIFEAFKPVQNNALQSVLDQISKDVGGYYRLLHPDEEVDNVKLRVVGEEGIEFEYDFHGKPTYPPMKYLSESHLNSLGICLFLASAKLFNKVSRFLVLDDIVTSFDLNHRRRLLRLIKGEFSDWQIIILTHESLWFEMIKRELAQGGWLAKEVEWDAENGILMSSSPADLRSLIAIKRKQYDVSNDIRKLLEATLKDICHRVGVKVEFRFNDENEHRMSSELLSELRSTVSRKCPSLKGHAIFSQLEGSSLIATVGSHDNPAEKIMGGDIDVALADIDTLVDLFLCTECGRCVDADHAVSGKEKITCRCGKKELDWKS